MELQTLWACRSEFNLSIYSLWIINLSSITESACKPYLRSDFAKALKYLDWCYPDVPAALAAVDLEEWA